MVYCIGEALIDMVSQNPDNSGYSVCPGGAPANCSAAVASLGGNCSFVGKVGNDRFGRLLKNVLASKNVNTDKMLLSDSFSTSLAFVSLDEKRDRSFEFYRPDDAADLMLTLSDVSDIEFTSEDTLYFGSSCLMSDCFKEALSYLVRKARRANAIIAMDVNLRPMLWKDASEMVPSMAEYIAYADIVKMSETEFPLVTGREDEKDAAEYLLDRSAEAVFITKGENGASVYLKDGSCFSREALSIPVCDTVGAGDAFFGGALYSLDGVGSDGIAEQNFQMILDFAVTASGLSVSRKGGIGSMPSFEEVMKRVKDGI